jgi:outer membrane receptor protein involved in Fe transport
LNQVVAETMEAGLRGTWANGRWHLGAFRTTSRDDIIFVSAGALTNQGYFANVDATRRQGVEAMLSGALLDSKLTWFINYTWLDATFGGDMQIASANNPEAEDGVIDVAQGDRLPGVPQHLAKVGVDYEIGRWSFALDANYAASQYVRGDEANLLDPLPAYVAVNAQVRYQLASQITASVGVQNLFDREYATFATLGDASGVLGTSGEGERFSTPAAPRSLWIAVRVKL